jgi:hypothetical protein
MGATYSMHGRDGRVYLMQIVYTLIEPLPSSREQVTNTRIYHSEFMYTCVALAMMAFCNIYVAVRPL